MPEPGERSGVYAPVRSYETSSTARSGATAASSDGFLGLGRNFGFDVAKSVVLGGINGLLLAVSILSGAAGGSMSWQYSLIMGFAGVVAGACTYGIDEFLSFKNHREYIVSVKRMKTWELKNSRDTVVQQFVKKYVSKGMSTADAEAVVAKMASYEGFFVNTIVAEEIGSSGEDDDASLLADGLVNIISFAAFGSVPLVVFFAFSALTYDAPLLYALALASAAACAFVLGGVKSNFSANNNSFFWLGFETLAMLAMGVFVSFSVGRGVSNILS